MWLFDNDVNKWKKWAERGSNSRPLDHFPIKDKSRVLYQAELPAHKTPWPGLSMWFNIIWKHNSNPGRSLTIMQQINLIKARQGSMIGCPTIYKAKLHIVVTRLHHQGDIISFTFTVSLNETVSFSKIKKFT